jgi:hypothetical protein
MGLKINRNIYLAFILIAIILLVVAISIYYGIVLAISHNETDIIVKENYMNNQLDFKHDDVFKNDSNTTGVTYTFWCYIADWQFQYDRVKPVLNKGPSLDTDYSNDELLQVSSSPAIFLNSKEPTMIFVFETEENDTGNTESIPYELTQIPLKTWFHITITFYDNVAEIYMDGSLIHTIQYDNPIKINYDNLHIAELGGFDGYISKLAVFSSVLSQSVIYKKYLVGPGNVDTDDCTAPSLKEDNSGNNDNNNINNGNPDNNTNSWNTIPLILSNEPLNTNMNSLDPVVTLYSRPYFEGSTVDLSVGLYTKWDLAEYGIVPETISGIKFLSIGYMITLYKNDEPTHTDGENDYVVIRNDSDWNGALKLMNNLAKSVKIEADPYSNELKATFYQRPSYMGWAVTLPVGKYTEDDLLAHGFQMDELSSYQIEDGYQASLYSEDFFNGKFAKATGNNTNMEELNNQVRSLKVEVYDDTESNGNINNQTTNQDNKNTTQDNKNTNQDNKNNNIQSLSANVLLDMLKGDINTTSNSTCVIL